MKENIRKTTDRFVKDFAGAQRHCRWGGDKYAATMACILLGNNKDLNEEDFKNAQVLIKSNEGVFSPLRSGYASKIVCAAVAASADQQYAIEEIKKIYTQLRSGFSDSSRLTIAATLIYICSDPLRYETVVNKAIEIFRSMKGNHPLLTWGSNVSNYGLLAMSNKGTDVICRDYEDCYAALSSRYRNRTASLYAAGAMCLFDGPAEAKAEGVVAWHQAHKAIRLDYTSDGLEIIALLSGIFGEPDNGILGEIREVSDLLATVRGMGRWGLGEKLRNMISAAIVIDSTVEDEQISAFAKQVILNVLVRMLEDDDAAATAATTTCI